MPYVGVGGWECAGGVLGGPEAGEGACAMGGRTGCRDRGDEWVVASDGKKKQYRQHSESIVWQNICIHLDSYRLRNIRISSSTHMV